MKHLMIDYENIQRANVSNIPADTHIWLFIGASQVAPSIEQFDYLFQHFGVERVHITKIYWAAPNALDFCLSYHLGKIIQSDAEAQVWILSRDQGFNVLVKQVCMEEKNNKVATAINFADAVEKINALNQAHQNNETAAANHENATVQAAETAQPETNRSETESTPPQLSTEQLARQYASRVFTLLREAANNNLPMFKRRSTLETNLLRHFKQTIWENAPELICEDDALQTHIHNAINKNIERGFIVADESDNLTYLFKDECFVEHAKRFYFNNPDALPKSTSSALGQLKNIANMWHLTPLDETAQKWLQQFQDEELLWVCGQSVSYISENDARDAELKSRFLSQLNREMGTKFAPNTQTALKAGIRNKAAEALVNVSEDEIYKIVANLISTKRVFINGDDLMWTSRPSAPAAHNPNKKNTANKKSPNGNHSAWGRVLQILKSSNRPSSIGALRVHLINSLSSLNQTESDIDRWINKLVDEGYLYIDGESGRLVYR